MVSYWRKYVREVLVNRLGGLSLPRKSVGRLTDCPDMTSDIYRGRKTTTQQQQQYIVVDIFINYVSTTSQPETEIIAHSLSLVTSYRPDMTETLFKRKSQIIYTSMFLQYIYRLWLHFEPFLSPGRPWVYNKKPQITSLQLKCQKRTIGSKTQLSHGQREVLGSSPGRATNLSSVQWVA